MNEVLLEGICQSCAMPINKPEQFGTDDHGKKTEVYCNCCFQQGAFTEPEIDMKEMLEKSVDFMAYSGVLPEPHIREALSEVIPQLKRWQSNH